MTLTRISPDILIDNLNCSRLYCNSGEWIRIYSGTSNHEDRGSFTHSDTELCAEPLIMKFGIFLNEILNFVRFSREEKYFPPILCDYTSHNTLTLWEFHWSYRYFNHGKSLQKVVIKIENEPLITVWAQITIIITCQKTHKNE